MEEVIDKEYIYEFDLKSFFDNIAHDAIIRYLGHVGLGAPK